MKRTARIVGLATAFLIGGATLAIAQPWDARYPCLPTGHSTIWRPIIFPAIIQALQPTDTGTVVATGGAAGAIGATGAGANWRRMQPQ